MAKIYLIWVVQHFTAQTYGITLLYCYKGGCRLTAIEKRVIALVLYAAGAVAVVRQFTMPEFAGNGFLAQHIPYVQLPMVVNDIAVGQMCVAAGGFIIMVLSRLVRQSAPIPLPALLTLITGVVIYLPSRDLSGIIWLYVPALYHGSQYIVLTLVHYLKETGRSQRADANELWSLARTECGIKYAGFLLLAGLFIFVGLPRLLQELGCDYTTAFASVFCAVSFHHFLTDAVIWKLRDPKLRQALSVAQ
jgi:hypothetical protein